MRPADRAECEALGLDPYVALAESREHSTWSQEVWKDGDLLCEWGWRMDSFITMTASVWMLSFTPVERHRVYFARESLRLMETLLSDFKVLRCEVYSNHEVALRWLRWLEFYPEAAVDKNGSLFFIMRRDATWEH